MTNSIASSHIAPTRILIVDDHPNTASMLARGLGQFNVPVEILTARGGQEALDVIGQSTVDVLITDFMMPGMNGLELIEKLQGGQEPAHTILVTAYDSPGLAATARRLKVSHYLVKPVQPEKIREIIGKVLENMHSPKPLFADLPTPSHFKILVADDQPDNVRLLATRLESEGYSFITAADGEEVLEQVHAEHPDLVLLDVNMPKKNGFEVLAEMRGDPKTAHIPVIILTAARTTPRDVREGLGLGADDYVTKPFDWRELAARVRAKLRVKHAEDALRRRNRALGLLPEIGQDLSARVDVDELSTVVLKRAVETLDAANGHLVVFHADGRTFHKMHALRDFAPWTWEEAQRRIVADGLIGHVLASGRGALIADTGTDGRWLKTPNDPVRSAMAVPLLGRRGVIGVVTLNHAEPGFFTAEHLSLLQAIASQAAIALENAQLYEIEHKRVTELVALNQFSREISLFTYSAELFERVPQLIRETLGYPVVSLWLNEGGAPKMRCLAGLRGMLASEASLRPSLLELAPKQVASTGQPAILSGAIEERTGPRAGTGTPPIHSAVAVPLFWEAKISGVLAVHSSQANAFEESDRVLLETLASQIVAAMERIRLFESVEHEQRRLSAVLHGVADAILVLDAQGHLQMVNPAGRRLFTDVATKLGHPLPSGRGYDEFIQLFDHARQMGAATQGEIIWPDARTFATLITPIDEGGEVAILHDVTHFKDLDRVKNEFIATASHDLKNPITSILGYTGLLDKAGALNEEQAGFVSRIQKAADQMYELVQNLLELARMDLGVELLMEPCDLQQMVTEVADEFQPQAAHKLQSLNVLPFEPPADFVADPARLRQVLRNLIGNAVKYTPEGGRITVAAEVAEARVRLHVQDTGLGIPATDLPYIFDKFYRVRTSDTKDIEGNGLGLAIVKSIIEQHGGQIVVESQAGQGSCFTLTLPLTPMPEGAATSLHQPAAVA